jgi:hypothetical protein
VPLLVFIGSATVLPDDLIVLPLAMINYPVRKLMVPMITGKFIHQMTFGLLAYYGVEFIGAGRQRIQIDVTLVIVIAFILYIAYQVEKNVVVRS